MRTLQPLDKMVMDKNPKTRYNMCMRSSTSPLFTLPSRLSLVCAITEFITCFLAQTKIQTPASSLSVVSIFRVSASPAISGTFGASRLRNNPETGCAPIISTISTFPLQSQFYAGTVFQSMKSIFTASPCRPSNNHLSSLALEDSPSMTF